MAQAATKKIDRKKESGIRYMVPSWNHDSNERTNAETSTKDGLERELYLIEVFALYV